MNLPDIKSARHLPQQHPDGWQRFAPIAFGVGIVAAGALISRFRPAVLDMPSATPRGAEPEGRGGQAVARVRDGAAHLAPDNMSAKLGKSLIMAGSAMLAARLLDELVD
jgi:hypothetical protein